MKSKFLLSLVSALLLAVALIIGTFGSISQRKTIDAMTKRQREVCTRLEWDLESIVRAPNKRNDLHARMAYHHLDEGLLQLCLGQSTIAGTSDADRCWIMQGTDDCYLDVARTLLGAYRRRAAR